MSIARFASADPFIPDPTNAQDFNRYSYVDNPLSLTDPSGFQTTCGDGGKPCPRVDDVHYHLRFDDLEGLFMKMFDFIHSSHQNNATIKKPSGAANRIPGLPHNIRAIQQRLSEIAEEARNLGL